MRNKNEVEAELQALEVTLAELKAQHDRGEIDISRYLNLKEKREARKAVLEQELDDSLARNQPTPAAPPEHVPTEIGPVNDPRRFGCTISVFVATLAAICLIAVPAATGTKSLLDILRNRPTAAPALADADAYFARGNTRGEQGDLEGAIADYTEALKLRPDDADIYYARGAARGEQGDLDRAIADYTEAIKFKPDDDDVADIYYTRGWTYREIGNAEAAKADLQKVLELRPEDPQFETIEKWIMELDSQINP